MRIQPQLRLAGLIAMALLGCLTAGMAFGQATPQAFDAFSLKPAATSSGPGGWVAVNALVQPDPVRLNAESISLQQLILNAYGLQPFQLSGGADWVRTKPWTITAAAAQPASHEQMMRMLQTALAERFQLRLSSAGKEMAVYALVAAPGGPKPANLETATKPKAGQMTFMLNAQGLANFLNGGGGQGRPVVDRTGIGSDAHFVLTLPLDPDCKPGAPCGVYAPHGAELRKILMAQCGLTLLKQEEKVTMYTVARAFPPAESN